MAWDRSAVELATMAIGVHVHGEPRWLQATLDSLRAHAPEAAVVLLPDGSDEPMRAALAAIDLPQLGTREPRGAPASWNRLVPATDAEVVVLLESGSVLAPGAIGAAALSLLAVLAMLTGLLIERWLFFAEARHVVTLYYGAAAG